MPKPAQSWEQPGITCSDTATWDCAPGFPHLGLGVRFRGKENTELARRESAQLLGFSLFAGSTPIPVPTPCRSGLSGEAPRSPPSAMIHWECWG